MLTLLASLLGFAASTIPGLLKTWGKNKQLQHDRELLKLQIDLEKTRVSNAKDNASDEIDLKFLELVHKANAEEDVPAWVKAVKGTIRPWITHVLFGFFMILKITLFAQLLHKGTLTVDAFEIIWDQDTKILFAAVVSFWFGHRM